MDRATAVATTRQLMSDAPGGQGGSASVDDSWRSSGGAGRLATERSPSADGPANGAFNAEEREENGGDCRGANGVLNPFNLNVSAADSASASSARSEPSAFQLRRSRTRTDDGALPAR